MLIHQLCWMKAETVVGITAHVKNVADIKCTKLFTDCVTSFPWQRIQWATVLIFGRGRLWNPNYLLKLLLIYQFISLWKAEASRTNNSCIIPLDLDRLKPKGKKFTRQGDESQKHLLCIIHLDLNRLKPKGKKFTPNSEGENCKSEYLVNKSWRREREMISAGYRSLLAHVDVGK